VLLAQVTSKSLALRVAALDALGTLGPAGQDRELLFALEDDNASVRLHAAMALSLAGGPDSVHTLLARLTQGATEDRTAIGLALSGALSRSREETAREIEPLLIASGAAVRDALIEGLGRMSGPTAGTVLAELLKHALETPDRSKIAEALAGHPEQRRAITALLADADPQVRADAVWASGISPSGTGDPGWFARATRLMSDSDLDAASNATAAVALLARASNDEATKQGAVASLCKAVKHPRAYVRANALAGLALLGARCDGGAAERRALLDDPSETVRAAAARSIGRTGPGTGTASPRARDDQRALSRCVADDKSGMVANACRGLGPRSPETAPLLVFVVPDGKSSPVPLAPYSLLRADGFIRSGRADRRGAIFERALPKGEVTLLVPAALAP
jgi:HEAT repeat protein